MKSFSLGFGGFCGITLEKGIDYMDVDMYGFEDILNNLDFTSRAALNLLGLPKNLQDKIQLSKPKNTLIKKDGYKISLKKVFEALGIKSYYIVNNDNNSSIKSLKKGGVVYVLDINSYGNLHFHSIDSHFNFEEIPNKYVLLYQTEKPIIRTSRLLNLIKNKLIKVIE